MANFNSGIYVIRCVSNSTDYIGSTNNFKRRFKDHKYRLSKNTHHNKKLQNCWNKYGKKEFIFDILEIVDANIENFSEVLSDRELFYIRNTENLLNLCLV